jgi:hypothetical protein
MAPRWRRQRATERTQARSGEPRDGAVARIRADLEQRGVVSAFSGAVAERLADIAADLAPAEYSAVLEGVAAAYGVHREGARGRRDEASEIQRLVADFAIELQKLDEGLRILSTYVLRIRERTAPPAPQRLLH